MSMNTVPSIRLVVFDFAGTIIDHGCMAPIIAFVDALKQSGIELSVEQARQSMGLHKRDHIRELLRLQPISEQWSAAHGRSWSESDVQAIYEKFLPLQADVARSHAELIPGVLQCAQFLRDEQIAIGSSTGYPRTVLSPVLDEVVRQGLQLDCSVCADEVPAGRPAPWMIYQNMQALGIFPPSSVVKVGDTVPDIVAARNAGAWSVGVTETGSHFGVSVEQLQTLDADERTERHEAVARQFTAAGAHAVITSVAELPTLLSSTEWRV